MSSDITLQSSTRTEYCRLNKALAISYIGWNKIANWNSIFIDVTALSRSRGMCSQLKKETQETGQIDTPSPLNNGKPVDFIPRARNLTATLSAWTDHKICFLTMTGKMLDFFLNEFVSYCIRATYTSKNVAESKDILWSGNNRNCTYKSIPYTYLKTRHLLDRYYGILFIYFRAFR